MPNMDPLVRQQGLLFEQSELLREQFVRFGAMESSFLRRVMENVRTFSKISVPNYGLVHPNENVHLVEFVGSSS